MDRKLIEDRLGTIQAAMDGLRDFPEQVNIEVAHNVVKYAIMDIKEELQLNEGLKTLVDGANAKLDRLKNKISCEAKEQYCLINKYLIAYFIGPYFANQLNDSYDESGKIILPIPEESIETIKTLNKSFVDPDLLDREEFARMMYIAGKAYPNDLEAIRGIKYVG